MSEKGQTPDYGQYVMSGKDYKLFSDEEKYQFYLQAEQAAIEALAKSNEMEKGS